VVADATIVWRRGKAAGVQFVAIEADPVPGTDTFVSRQR
jgi:hypothetical protein